MKYYYAPHQNKGDAYYHALDAAGFTITPYPDDAKFGLLDHDYIKPDRDKNEFVTRPELEILAERPTFCYPHAARPQIIMDCYPDMRWPWSTMFVAAEGHAEILDTFYDTAPLVVAGWSLSPIREFTPVKRYRGMRVLFAPIHPNGNGWMSGVDKHANIRVHNWLADWFFTGEIELRVRTVKMPMIAGLTPAHDAIDYYVTRADGSYDDIEWADLVISHQTFAYMAVAMGKPTIMYHDIACHSNNMEPLFWARYHHEYANMLRFPIQFEDYYEAGRDYMVDAALEGSQAVEDWKRRMIGNEFRPEIAVETVRRFL